MSDNAAQTETKKESTAKRDFLCNIERDVRKKWDDAHLFMEDAPEGVESSPDNKYLVTFPYPYMNGRLHLGHTFTLTKVEFAANYQRLKGKYVLFPFGFHCTGMPIKACADKLKREIEQFGNPPRFPDREDTSTASDKEAKTKEAGENFHAQKSKVQAKSGGGLYQWEIMKSMGIPEAEIPKFSDATFWLYYFPPHCKSDLTNLGMSVDWRRSFITTDVNPYYDSFVRWQFNTLKEKNKVQFGNRFTIYSPKDGQPCADHDRASGEGVLPQEYTLIKIEVISPFPAKLKSLEGRKVFLVAGTLRPETMYGQTNVWVLPDGAYGAYEVNKEGDVFICTERSARNMAYQGLSKEPGQVSCLVTLTGWDILGIPCKAPLTKYEKVYTLPMLTISPKKGTGIVTSVPSDAPDDYINLEEWKRKPAFREKYKITDEMVMPYEVIEIIDVPELGSRAAAFACDKLKIKSPNDRDLLNEAKDLVYTKGFYEGKLKVGEHAGKLVRDAKPLIKEKMIASGQAVTYAEPADVVMSRSGDECVVALTDQWYLDYGETNWRAEVEKHLKTMDFYSPITKNKFEIALGWLNQWACSRTYGLGTRLPWDDKYLIESLSDSTIYMAYYAISYLLHGDSLDGSTIGPAQIKPEQLTKKVWDHIFMEGPYPADCGIPESTLAKLRKEFNFWYPVDIRVSGKDLITNHLVFMLYNHVAMWPEKKNKLPRTIRCNGHVLLNGDKMSKSTGNFLTLAEGIERFTADGMRFALADAGDSLDDANFETKTANAALLRLHAQITWTEETIKAKDTMRAGPADTFLDKVFASQINKAVVETDAHYERTNFREALRTGFFELQAARDSYRQNIGSFEAMNKDLILRFIEIQAIIMAPIIPHFSEHIWGLLGKTGSVRKAKWPASEKVDTTVLAQFKYLETVIYSFRQRRDLYMKPKGKKNEKVPELPAPTKASILVARAYPAWMQKALTLLRPLVEESIKNNEGKRVWPDDKVVMKTLTSDAELKPNAKQLMPFIGTLKDDFAAEGLDVLNLEVPFDEKQLMVAETEMLKRHLDLQAIEVNYDETVTKCQPGKPYVTFSS